MHFVAFLEVFLGICFLRICFSDDFFIPLAFLFWAFKGDYLGFFFANQWEVRLSSGNQSTVICQASICEEYWKSCEQSHVSDFFCFRFLLFQENTGRLMDFVQLARLEG